LERNALSKFENQTAPIKKAYNISVSTAESAYKEGLVKRRSLKKAFDKATKTWQEAYIAAYARPVSGDRRRVRDYDRRLVLKVANYERRRYCPKL